MQKYLASVCVLCVDICYGNVEHLSNGPKIFVQHNWFVYRLYTVCIPKKSDIIIEGDMDILVDSPVWTSYDSELESYYLMEKRGNSLTRSITVSGWYCTMVMHRIPIVLWNSMGPYCWIGIIPGARAIRGTVLIMKCATPCWVCVYILTDRPL